MQEKFVLFGMVHWVIMGVTAVASVGAIWFVRRFSAVERRMDWVLAVFLAVNKVATVYFAWSYGNLTLQNGLPMHLCDWTSLTAIFVLVWRRQLLYELTYFWGLSGTVQAILTPEVTISVSDPRFYTFFISHCGIVVVVFYLTLGLGMRPGRFSLWKVFGATQVYLVVASVVNWVIGANYGYFCAKPATPSLLDYMGPWPWYVVSMEVLVLVFFSICYAPFYFSPQRRKDAEIF